MLNSRPLQPETQIIVDLFRDKSIGSTLTYEEISQAVGFSVLTSIGRGRLQSARRVLMKEFSVALGTVHRVGLRILSDGEAVQMGRHNLRSIGTAARRARRICLSVREYEKLSSSDKIMQQSIVAVTAAVDVMASPRALDSMMNKKVEPLVDLGKIVAALGVGATKPTSELEEP